MVILNIEMKSCNDKIKLNFTTLKSWDKDRLLIMFISIFDKESIIQDKNSGMYCKINACCCSETTCY